MEEQDWQRPLREDWVATLRGTLATEAAPAIVLAHSIGCLAVAHLLSEPGAERIRPCLAAAILVAPADVERDDAAPELASFRPIPLQPLGVPALLIASTDDPYCTLARATAMAAAWGAGLHTIEKAGHIHAASGYGPWPEGWAYVKHWLAVRGLTWPANGGDIA